MADNRIPAGRYEASILAFGPNESKTGSPQFCVEFKIVEEGKEKGRTITWYGNMGSDAATDITMRALNAMGMKGDDISSEELLDKTNNVQLVIDDHTWDNKTSSRIKFINKLGGGGFKKSESAVKIALSLKDKIRASQARLQQEGGAAPSGPPAPSGAPQADDDIPF